MTDEQILAFFLELLNLTPQEQCKRVRKVLVEYPAITESPQFIRWGVRMAEFTR